MTEQHSSALLAEALDAEGFTQLAKRARKHEFHDFLSPHALPQHELVAELAEFKSSAAERIKLRVMEGDFDASKDEADKWAASPEGQAIMQNLGPSAQAPETGLADGNHALLVGHMLGVLSGLQAVSGTPTDVEPIQAGPNIYTNKVRVRRPSGEYIITVEKT